MGSHNGSKKRRPVAQVDPKVIPSAKIVQLHPLAQFQQQERLIPFSKIKIGDKFQLPRTESSPKDVECPVFVKTELSRKDNSNPISDLFNCKVGNWKGWLPDIIEVIQVF